MKRLYGLIYEYSPEFIRNKIQKKVPRFIIKENGIVYANITFETISGFIVKRGSEVNMQNIYRIASTSAFANSKCFIHEDVRMDYYIGKNTEVLKTSFVKTDSNNPYVSYKKNFLISNDTQIVSDIHITIEHNEELFRYNKSWLDYDNLYTLYINADFKNKVLIYMDSAYMDFAGYGLNSVVFTDLKLYNYNNSIPSKHAFLDFRKNISKSCDIRSIRMYDLHKLEKKHKKFLKELYASSENM